MRRFKLEVGAATEVGRRRERNEDRYAAYVPPAEEDSELAGLLLVADGMGGERGGAEASELTVRRLVEKLGSGSDRSRDVHAGQDGLLEVLRRTIDETSDEILRLGEKDPALSGLGSTLVLAAFTEEAVLIAHVGDSRCYRLRRDRLRPLTTDHTWVADQVAAGAITEEEVRHHPQRHVLTRTLGDAQAPSAEVRSETLEDDDLFILCSDGLTKALSDGEILNVAGRFPRPQDLAEALVALANDRDGSDNITAVVCRCRDAERAETAADPDDTEPIVRPEDLLRPGPSAKSWLVAAAVLLVLLLLSYFGPRFVAARAFEHGVEHARDRRYLHARQEFSKAIRLGLDQRRSEQLIDILLEFPSPRRLEEEREAREPSAEGGPDAPKE